MSPDRWVTIHQPCYFPWLGLFHKIAHSDVLVLFDDCQLSHRSWIRRVYINAGGSPLLLTVPVHFSRTSATTVAQTLVDDDQHWRMKHHRTLVQAYRATPHFGDIEPVIDQVRDRANRRIMDINLAGMRLLLVGLEIATPMVMASDLRSGNATGTERLVHLVRAAGGTGYVSGRGSDDYLEPARFAEAGLTLAYQRFTADPYPQRKTARFLPGLSIIDAVANLGFAETRRMIDRQTPAFETVAGP